MMMNHVSKYSIARHGWRRKEVTVPALEGGGEEDALHEVPGPPQEPTSGLAGAQG